MIVGVISVGVMTVGVLSVGVMTFIPLLQVSCRKMDYLQAIQKTRQYIAFYKMNRGFRIKTISH